MSKDVKMVIIIRKDLKMGKGKISSQVAHACMKIFFEKFKPLYEEEFIDNSRHLVGWKMGNLPYFEEYINGAFKKIIVSVNSEEELLAIHQNAVNVGIHSSLIRDAGLTEFNGVKTYTAVGIGPWSGGEIDKITGHLPLL